MLSLRGALAAGFSLFVTRLLPFLLVLGLAPSGVARASDAEIVMLTGRGDSRETAEADWKAAAVGQKVFAGWFVRTREQSQMGLLMRDRTQIRLSPLSIINIKSLASGQMPTRLELPQGRAWSQAKQRTTPDPDVAARPRPLIEVQTPAGVASVRGTDWELVVDPDGTSTLTVLSGAVDFANEYGSVTVLPNEQARTVPGQAPVKTLLTAAADRVQWVTAYRPQPRRWVTHADAGLESQIRAIEAGNHEGALAELARPGRFGPLAAALLTADVRLYLGQSSEAIAVLEPHAKDGEGEPMASALLARALLIAGRIADAERVATASVRRHPAHAEALLASAEVARLQGDAPAALRAAHAASQVEPQNPESWYLIGRVQTEREFVSAAREALGRAIGLRADGAGYRGELATLETFANDFASAEPLFRAALEQHPDDYVALTGLGVLQLKRGSPEAALESFLKAGVIEPRYSRGALFSAVAYYQLADRGRALEQLAKAASLDPRDPLPHLLASLLHHDALEFGAAIEAARRAQERIGYLKSLNQVLTDPKGTANLGSALSAFGMEEWSQAYAYDSYNAYWSGSHLFLADRFAGSFNRNSELFMGFLSDPTVFGASNRFSSLVAVPGHYANLALEAGRDYLAQTGGSVTVNGYSIAAAPFAYSATYERTHADSEINATGADGRIRVDSNNLILGLGMRPVHELGLFYFGNTARYDGRFADRSNGLLDDPFTIDYRRHDAGINYRFNPTNQAWLKVGIGREQMPVSGVLFSQESADALNAAFGVVNVIQPLGRLNAFDYELKQSDVQWRHTFDATETLQVSWGLEHATQTRPFRLETEFPTNLALPAAQAVRTLLSNDERLESTSAYVSLRHRNTPALDLQFDLHYQDVESHFVTDTGIQVVGGGFFPAPQRSGSARERELNPRFGLRWRPAPGHTLRIATQAWRKPAGVNTLAPVDTVGIELDDRIVRAGGKLSRVRVQHEVTWRESTFAQWFLDFKQVDNPDDPAVVADFALDQLEKLRNRRRTYALRADYLEDTPKFREGRAGQFGVAVNHLLGRSLSFAMRYYITSTRNTSAALEGRALPYHSRHFFSTSFNWQPRSRVIVGPVATYRSQRYRDDANLDPLTAGWLFGAFAYWESEDKRLSVAATLDQLHSDKQSSIRAHPVAQLQAAYRF